MRYNEREIRLQHEEPGDAMKVLNKFLRNNIRNNLWNGIAWSIGFNFVTPFIGVLAAQLGATNRDYALLSSIPALLTILINLPATMIIARFRQQKRIIAGTILLCRFFYFLLIFVPYLQVSAMTALILLVGLYNATNSVIAVAWQSMMGEIIPTRHRNRVFAQRNIWTGVSGMIVAFIAGWGIDRLPYPYGYQIAFSIGFAFALLETWYFMRLRIPSEETETNSDMADPGQGLLNAESAPREAAEKNGNESAFESGSHHRPGEPFIYAGDENTSGNIRDNRVRKSILHSWMIRFKLDLGRSYYLFSVSAIIYIFAWQAAWPIYTKVKVDTLLATNTMMSIDTIVGAIGSLFGFQLWARIADHKGTGWTVFASALMLALTPYCWIYAPNMTWVYVYDLVGGVATAGFQQSAFNRLLELVPENGRQRAIAIYTTLSQVSAIFAPIIGMMLYTAVPFGLCMFIMGSVRVVGSLCFLFILSSMVMKMTKPSRQRSLH